MTKNEAIQKMKKGVRMSHTFFQDYEYITINSSGLYVMEDGATIDEKTFWLDRPHKNWESGWYESEKEVTPAPLNSSKHTEGKWQTEYQQYEYGSNICVADENGTWIADCGPEGIEEAEANAAHIVKCVNNHNALIEALREGYIMALGTNGMHRIENQTALCIMRDALADAEGMTGEDVNDKYEDIRLSRKIK